MADIPRTDDATYTHLGSDDHGANLKLKKAVPAALSKELESENADLRRQLEEAREDVSVAQAIESLRTAGYEIVIADPDWHYVVQITGHGNTFNYDHQTWKDAIIDAATAATKPKSEPGEADRK